MEECVLVLQLYSSTALQPYRRSLSSFLPHGFVDTEDVLCIDYSVAVHIADVVSIGSKGEGTVLHVLINREYVLCVDGSIAVHIFQLGFSDDEQESFTDATGVPKELAWKL